MESDGKNLSRKRRWSKSYQGVKEKADSFSIAFTAFLSIDLNKSRTTNMIMESTTTIVSR